MKIRFKLFGRVFAFYCFKVRKAYGIKSGTHSHYLLMDFDTGGEDVAKRISGITKAEIMEQVWQNLQSRFPNADKLMYETKNGFHAIVFQKFTFKQAIIEMVKTPYIDLGHVSIGINRGYWFLETKNGIPVRFYVLHPDLEFMVIERGDDKENA